MTVKGDRRWTVIVRSLPGQMVSLFNRDLKIEARFLFPKGQGPSSLSTVQLCTREMEGAGTGWMFSSHLLWSALAPIPLSRLMSRSRGELGHRVALDQRGQDESKQLC